MIVNAEHEFAFVHVPKTGGSTITAEIARALGTPETDFSKGWQARHHNVGGMHSGFNSTGPAGGVWSFGFVRNPYDLWTSRYFSRSEWCDRMSFEEFVTTKPHPAFWGVPMVNLLTCPYTNRQVSFVGRYERYAADVATAFKHIGLKLDTDRMYQVNATPDRPTWEEVQTDATLRTIRAIHAPDFDAFHYER